MVDQQDVGGEALWTPLPWDSEFFGIQIGTVDLDGKSDEEVRTVVSEARAAGIECLYGALDANADDRLYPVQQAGFRFLDASVAFNISPNEPRIPQPEGITFREATGDDIEELTPLSETLSPWSRYALDPRFGLDAASRMQQAWMERGATQSDGKHALLLAIQDEQIVSFVGWVGGDPPHVDAAASTRRGGGAANYLMQVARDRVPGQTLDAFAIAIRNTAAQRYMGRCQYRISGTQYRFHCWLDEAP